MRNTQEFNLEQQFNKHQINFIIEAIQNQGSPKVLIKKEGGIVKTIIDNLFDNKSPYAQENKGYFLNQAALKFITIKEGAYAREHRIDAKILKKQEENFKLAILELQKNHDFKLEHLTSHELWKENLLRYRLNQNEFKNFMAWVFNNFTKDSLENKKKLLLVAAKDSYPRHSLAHIFWEPEESQMLIDKLALTPIEQEQIWAKIVKNAYILPDENMLNDIENYLSYAYMKDNLSLKVKMIFDNMAQANIENTRYDEIHVQPRTQELKNCIEKFHKAGKLNQTPTSSIEAIIVFMLQLNALQLHQWKKRQEIKEIKQLPILLSSKKEIEHSICDILALFHKEPEKHLEKLKEKAFSLKFCKYLKSELSLSQKPIDIQKEMLLEPKLLTLSLIKNHEYYANTIKAYGQDLIKIEKELLNLNLKYTQSEMENTLSPHLKTTFKL